jgi:type I restriction enzyme M protein
MIRLLGFLGFEDNAIKTKKTLKDLVIGKGSRKENYRPDYVCFVNKRPRLVIDAKDPKENVDDYIYQVSGYSLALNQKYEQENPVEYFILSNGTVLKVFEWDKEKPILTLTFSDFQKDNPKLRELIEVVSYSQLKDKKLSETRIFDFVKPEPRQLAGIFQACHDLIWKKDKIKPTEAFFEFTKIFFVKLHYDRLLYDLIKNGKTPSPDDFTFSVEWIEKQEKWDRNPFNSILFKNLRDAMEKDIEKKDKKRIFNKDEEINLKPSTIKEVVALLEHLNLFGIDEDLNGRMFETFLNATVRGKDLGQFFTPRSVVKFMVQLADLEVSKDHVDNVLDGLCGSGGFLIEAMAVMWTKIERNNSLSASDKEKIKKKIASTKIWGVDADKNISRVARMNMFLHGDGSNMIFWLPDFLDKKIDIEEGIKAELKEEAEDFKKRIIEDKTKFDVVLTNPPFSMKYESAKKDEAKILEEYEIAFTHGKDNSKKIKSSLKSNVLSIERYSELLNTGAKLITIIDESVLNADSERDYREFIRQNFVIKAVISLPKNTFVNADTGVKTSVLYLIKKTSKSDEQSDVFMAIANNVGHGDTGKPTPELNDLPKVLEDFRRFENGN